MTSTMSPLDTILADTARDLAYAQRDGRPLGPVEAEAAARIAAYYQPRLCKCGAPTGNPHLPQCNRCWEDDHGDALYGARPDED